MGKKGGNRGVRIKQMGPKAPNKMMNPMDALTIPPEEMIHLPPTPDRSYQIFWPIRESSLLTVLSIIVLYCLLLYCVSLTNAIPYY
jgi:signal recognition particle subunit SRP19